MELARIAELGRRFYILRSKTLLSNINYTEEKNPIVPIGDKATTITDIQHYVAAHLTLEHCFGIRAMPRTYQQIFLYRNSDKKKLSKKEKKSTVPSSSIGRSRFELKYSEITPFWTVEKTAAWILGGIYSRLPFYLTSNPTEKTNFIEGNIKQRSQKNSPAIYAREILQILSSGYTVDFATKEETPHTLKNAKDHTSIILRPPPPPYTDIRTRLIPELWDRNNKTLNSLFITYNGETLTAEKLNTVMQDEIDEIQNMIDAANIISSLKYGSWD